MTSNSTYHMRIHRTDIGRRMNTNTKIREYNSQPRDWCRTCNEPVFGDWHFWEGHLIRRAARTT